MTKTSVAPRLFIAVVLASSSLVAMAQRAVVQSFVPPDKAYMQWRVTGDAPFSALISGEWSHSEIVHFSNAGNAAFPLNAIVSTNDERLEVLAHNCPRIVEAATGCDVIVRAKAEGLTEALVNLLAFGGTDNMETSSLALNLRARAQPETGDH